MTDPFVRARRSASALAARTGADRHDVAVICGSGWQTAADVLGAADFEFPVDDLPGFPRPEVGGHRAVLRSLEVGSSRVLVVLGRVHAYEGHGVHDVVHAVRTAVLSGCEVVVLTNASGGLRPDLAVGRAVLIADHLNLTGQSPLTGLSGAGGPGVTVPSPFVDLSSAYSPRLRALAAGVDPTLTEGVYAGVGGPQYETPAEIGMLRTLGADLVGMSTVHETIAAVHLGAEVLGVSLVTNLAAGSGAALDHRDVLDVATGAAPAAAEVIRQVISQL